MRLIHPLSKLLFAVVLLIGIGNTAYGKSQPKKREFRGAWIQCVNGQFQGIGTQEMQRTLRYQLDELQKDGVNAIIFQVRAECDALYPSRYEPWSKFLTGRQGTPPSPYWDPLQWMIDECHRRGMELHAWINPYRAKTKTTSQLAANHIAVTHPDRIFSYDGLYILNPALPENRDYICRVVDDIVSRYDVDGIHIDDYFYPYPAAGQTIPDQRDFQHDSRGFTDIRDWRRDNVDLFVKQLSESVHQRKPWVKFGVSPFGIYRNQKSDPRNGSRTSGLQNYDDLYADVLKWVNNGWVDYCVPQLYWEIGNRAADYQELIGWWNRKAANRPLYIGEDVLRTVKYADPQTPASHQLPAKHRLHRQAANVQGTVLWYAKAVVDNPGNYGTLLRTDYWRYPALQPLMPFIDGDAPSKPKKVKAKHERDGCYLTWKAPKGKGWQDEAHRYVVYRFLPSEPLDTDDPSKIVGMPYDNRLRLDYKDGRTKYIYVVTALDRMSNESTGKKKKVKL
ncbi:glycoside hydrolase family 10 protein [Prevotella denticola]|uniref:glycoside hydrolase family 10 protein n=1 Tax=Prevotella denticola TaxID=28129 RepID=UPI001CAE193E|nr:family 10 glycosylhydrolase [Prevotella denticola]MBF1387643.1 family 10 glycosylhydrolase [Prevotella denticola]